MYGIAVGRLGKFAAISPANWLMTLWPEPLNGTCTMLTCASVLNSSPERCGLVPRPAEPNVKLPGFAFASAINCSTVLAGTDGCSVRILGAETACEIGARSRSASYGT